MIPHGIAPEFSFSRGPVNRVKAFAYVGTFSELKGIHMLIAAFRRLSGAYTLELYGTGTDAYERQLKQLAGNDQRVHFRGPVALSACRRFTEHTIALLSLPCGMRRIISVVREAIATGCLVVASQMGAMPEAIQEGKNGFLFKAGDEDALLNALECAARFSGDGFPSRQPSTIEEASKYEAILQAICSYKIMCKERR